MELLDRYLHAVKFWLPRQHQEDLAAELREDIQSQIEEKEAALGRAGGAGGGVHTEAERPPHAGRRALSVSRAGDRSGAAAGLLVRAEAGAAVDSCAAVDSIAAHGFTISIAGVAQIIWVFWSATFTAIGIISVVFAAIERYHNGANPWRTGIRVSYRGFGRA